MTSQLTEALKILKAEEKSAESQAKMTQAWLLKVTAQREALEQLLAMQAPPVEAEPASPARSRQRRRTKTVKRPSSNGSNGSARKAVRATTPKKRASSGNGETVADLIVKAVRAKPQQVWDVALVEKALRASGWKTASADPSNVIRTVLARIASEKKITKVSPGKYQAKKAGPGRPRKPAAQKRGTTAKRRVTAKR